MKQSRKKITAFVLAFVCMFAAMPATTYAEEAPSVQTTGTTMTEDMSSVKAVHIKAVGIPQDYSTEHSLSLGSELILEAQIEKMDGSMENVDSAMVDWSVKKKDGSSCRAVLLDKTFADGTARVGLYAPYGQPEELIVTAKAGVCIVEYDVTTFEDKKLNGDRYFRFHMGNIDSDHVGIDQPEEIWDADTKSYTVVLPDIFVEDVYELGYTQQAGDRVFIGWKEEATGKIYKEKTEIKRAYKGKAFATFTAQWKELQKGDTFVNKDYQYKVTSDKKGKKEVSFVKCMYYSQCIHAYKIPDTVKYEGITYRVTGIEKQTLKRAAANKIVIGKNVSAISANAFANCPYLKKIVIQSKKLNASKISKKAFSGISKQVTIMVPKEKKRSYTKLLRKAGLNKSVKIKAL